MKDRDLKIVVSPAKTLDFESELPTTRATKSKFLTDSRKISRVVKKLKTNDLMQLMDISENLAALNVDRNKKWNTPFTSENSRPAIFAFMGDVYQGIDMQSFDIQNLDRMQHSLRILSGLYGLLKPLDLIQPYRLEMGTKLKVGENADLYEFWKTKITASLNKEMNKNTLLVNLASNEYFSALDAKVLKCPVIVPEFKDFHDGKLKIISFFAKKARGMMVRHLIDNDVKTIDGIRSFKADGYVDDANLSKGNRLVFTR